MSQKDLAKIMGVHDARISGIERGRVDTRISTVGKLADALGIKPAVLLT